jgi:isoquinoline 1-oxidoreductase beta subunit
MLKPVKLIWSRAEDFTKDFYRPGSYNLLNGGLDASGKIVAWSHKIVSPSIYSWLAEKPVIQPAAQTEVEASATEGADELPYGVGGFRCDWVQHEVGVPVFWWRSVGHSQNGFIVESFVDELAVKAQKDPLQFRLDMLGTSETAMRHKGVLQLAAEKAGWASPPGGQGVGLGIAVHESFGTVVAMVAEVAVSGTTVKVRKVVVAVDCGLAINPLLVSQQMESSVAQALGAALNQKITVAQNQIQQKQFSSCSPLKMSQMPKVETYIVPSDKAPAGIGEPGVPPVAAAVCNAIF